MTENGWEIDISREVSGPPKKKNRVVVKVSGSVVGDL